MRNNLYILFFIFYVSNLLKATGGSSTELTTAEVRQKLANYISSKNQVNHIDRKQLTGGDEVLRKEKNHRLVLQELVQQNSYEIIAQDSSAFLKNALKYSPSYEKIVEFSQQVVEIMQANTDSHLNLILQETLTKLLTLVNLNYIGQRLDQFYYLYDYYSFRSFLHDLNEKKIRLENQCKRQENQQAIECVQQLSQIYRNLYDHFAQFQLAQVTGPEFKDKYQEEIDSSHFEQIDFDQIAEIAQMHIRNIEQDAQNTMQKLKKLVQDLVARRNNVLSRFYESQPSKQKVYENIVNTLNRQIVIKNSKELYLNFYSYHFILSLEKALNTAYMAEQNQKKKDFTIPFKSYVYERNNVETFLKDANALKDYLRIMENKQFDNLLKDIEYLINFFSNLDDTHSDKYVLEKIKVIEKPINKSNTMIFNSTIQSKRTTRIQNPTFINADKSQKLQESEKEKIRNDIMNYHQNVPKSDLVKLFVAFRPLYETSQVHKKRTCERSFYELLNSAGKMFLGSSTLNYLGEEMQIYGYIYRYDFHNKLIKSIFEFQNCLDFLANVQDIQQKLQEISVRVQQLYRLNHDFIELKIEYKMDFIKKQLNIQKPKNLLNEQDLEKINKFKQDLKQNFMKQKNIEENLDVVYEKTDQNNLQQPVPLQTNLVATEQNNQNQESQNPLNLMLQGIPHQRQSLVNDIQDDTAYEKPEFEMSNLQGSKLQDYFVQFKQQDLEDKYINKFKSYQKNVHFLIKAMNQINNNVVQNKFGQGKKGNWISFKYPSSDINELLKQIEIMEAGVNRIYSKESDDTFIILQKLKDFIRQNIHSTRGFYYEKEFIKNQNDQEEEQENGLDIDQLNLDKLEGSKLYPLLESNVYHLNKLLSKNKNLQENLQDEINELQTNLNELINDDNLELVQRKSKRQNQKLTYGKFKFNTQKVKPCIESLNNIINNIDEQESEEFKDLQEDINSVKNFFNNLKSTRQFYYESTDAVFDDEGKFKNFEELQSQNSEEENSSEDQVQIRDDIIQEQSIEESSDQEQYIPELQMNLEQIKYSKLYSPLKNIQEAKFTSQQQLDLFNDIAKSFNTLVDYEDLVKTAVKKIKKQKVKIGSYHYQAEPANKFLKQVKNLQVQVEEQDKDQMLKQDLQFVVSIFNTFLSTRKFYYEPFSATLIDANGNEISKPLFNTDFDKLSESRFSMISDTGLDIQNALQTSSSEQTSEEVSEDLSSNNINVSKVEPNSHQEKAIKNRRRIYVIDIVTCENCVKDGYVQVTRK